MSRQPRSCHGCTASIQMHSHPLTWKAEAAQGRAQAHSFRSQALRRGHRPTCTNGITLTATRMPARTKYYKQANIQNTGKKSMSGI